MQSQITESQDAGVWNRGAMLIIRNQDGCALFALIAGRNGLKKAVIVLYL
jgi:hypothetical protein